MLLYTMATLQLTTCSMQSGVNVTSSHEYRF